MLIVHKFEFSLEGRSFLRHAPARSARRAGHAGHFDPIIASSRACAAKPDPAIFRRALTKCDANAEQAVHVGDTYDLDVLGARAAGVAAILIDRVGRATPPDCPVVCRLDEVPALLERDAA